MKKEGVVLSLFLLLVLSINFIVAESVISPVNAKGVSDHSSTYASSKVYDSDLFTYWFTTQSPTFPVDLVLEFNDTYTFTGIELAAHTAYLPMAFEIFSSDDGTNWDLVTNAGILSSSNGTSKGRLSTSEFHRISFSSREAKYIKLSQTSNKINTYGGAFAEIRGVVDSLSPSSGGGGGSSSGDVSNSLLDMTDNALQNYLEGSDDYNSDRRMFMIPLTRETSLDSNNEGGFVIAVKNLLVGTGANDASFSYEVVVSDDDVTKKCGVGAQTIEREWISSGRTASNISIPYGNFSFFKVFFDAGGASTDCTFRLRANVRQNNINYATNIMDVTIRGGGNSSNRITRCSDYTTQSSCEVDASEISQSDPNCKTGEFVVDGVAYVISQDSCTCTWSGNSCDLSYNITRVGGNSCYEWDGGKDFFHNSYLEFNDKYIDNDYCVRTYKGGYSSQTEQCGGDDCGVQEYFCLEDNSSYGSEVRLCESGCYNGECIDEFNPRTLSTCDDLKTFVENPRDFELVTQSDTYFANNYELSYSSKRSDNLWIDGQTYAYDYSRATFSSRSPNNYDGYYYYYVYDFDDSMTDDVLQSFFERRVSYAVCDILNIDDSDEVYYACDGSFWDFDNLDDYPNSKSGSIYWIHDNALFEVRVYYNWYDWNNYNGDYERYMLENIRDEVQRIQNKQEDSLAFLADVKDNRAQWVNPMEFYYSLPWEMRQLFAEDAALCPSTLDTEVNSCNPHWRCNLEPLICPPHGEQTRVCVDTQGCFDTRETQQQCNPGICSGCNVPRWFQSEGLNQDGSWRDTICMPYGARFGVNNGWSINQIVEANEASQRITVSYANRISEYDLDIYMNGTGMFTLFNKTVILEKGMKYDFTSTILSFVEDDEGLLSWVLYVDDLYYDSTNPNASYADLTFRFEIGRNEYEQDYLNMYCDYDGQVKSQKERQLNGDWATCQNDFECESNVCSSGECIEVQDLLNEVGGFKELGVKVLCRFADLFGIQEYDSCLLENLGA